MRSAASRMSLPLAWAVFQAIAFTLTVAMIEYQELDTFDNGLTLGYFVGAINGLIIWILLDWPGRAKKSRIDSPGDSGMTDMMLPRRDVILPVVRNQLNDLAATEPGPAAQSKAAEILKFIAGLLSNPEVNALFPAGWKLYVSAAVAAIGLLLSGGILGRVTAPGQHLAATPVKIELVMPPQPQVVPVVAPVTSPPLPVPVPIQPLTPISPILPPVPKPPLPITPKLKLILYTTPGVDAKEIAADLLVQSMANVSVDETVHPVGSAYLFNGKSIPLPALSLIDADGKVLDVVTFATAADVVSFVGTHSGKKQ